MASFNYLRDFVINVRSCNFRPTKGELMKDIRDNRLTEFKYLEVEIPKVGETKEIPLFLLHHIEEMVNRQSLISDRVDVLNIPLLNVSSHINHQVSTYPSFVKHWFNYYGVSRQIGSIKLKEDIFYTLPGLLLDSNFKVLVYMGIDVICLAQNAESSFLNRKIVHTYIAPEVFVNTSVMCRNLVKKFIPDLIDVMYREMQRESGVIYDILVKDREDIIHAPVAPHTLDVTEEAYADLYEGIENILANNEYI